MEYQRTFDLGFDCQAVVFFRPPTFEELQAYQRDLLANSLIMQSPDTPVEAKRDVIIDMTKLAYKAGKAIIIDVECKDWPPWANKIRQTKKMSDVDIITKYYSDEVSTLGNDMHGSGRGGRDDASPEAVEAAKQFMTQSTLEAEQAKN